MQKVNKILSTIVISSAVLSMPIFLTSVFADSSSSGSTSATANGTASVTSTVSVSLVDIISLRILDETASSELSSLSLELTPTPNGVFTKESFVAEAATSNATGYKLYMTSIGEDYSDSYTTELVNTDSTIDSSVGTIPTLPSGATITEADFRISNSSYKNRWGYSTDGLIIDTATNDGVTTINSITENTDTSDITYTDIPENTESRQIDNKTEATDKGLTPVTVGVNASSAIASGTYENTLELTAVANPLEIDYQVAFNANLDGAGGESSSEGTVSNMPESLTASTLASSYTFDIPQDEPSIASTSDPDKPTSGIIGWSTSPDSRAGDGSGPDGLYVYGDSITLTADDGNSDATHLTLYAIWGDFFSITYMQEMNSDICNTVYTPSNATGTSARAIVARGDGVSSVSGAGSTTIVDDLAGYKTIVSADGSAYVAQRSLYDIRDGKSYTVRKLADGNCWMTENLAYVLDANSAYVGSKNDRTTFEFNTGSSCGSNNSECIMNGNTVYDSSWRQSYYSWYAMTAGIGQQSDTNKDIDGSVCPRSWKVPSNYSFWQERSYGALTDAYGITINGSSRSKNAISILETFPINLKRSGFYTAGGFSYGATNSRHYWSSSASSSESEGYYFVWSPDVTNPQSVHSRYFGFNVRCVAL